MFKPVAAKSIKAYIDSIAEPRRSEVLKVDKLIRKNAPKLKPYFAYNMIGYGTFHYKSKSGREGDWPIIALASQKNYISVYICATKDGKYVPELYREKFGKASVGRSCISFKKLEDMNVDVLEKAISDGVHSPPAF